MPSADVLFLQNQQVTRKLNSWRRIEAKLEADQQQKFYSWRWISRKSYIAEQQADQQQELYNSWNVYKQKVI